MSFEQGDQLLWRSGNDRSNLVLGVLVILFGYHVCKTVYRLTIHPLATVPGPLLAKITGWYPTVASYQGRRHLNQYECHQRYGPVVRWAPNYVIFDTISAIQSIYGDSRRNNVRKDDLYQFFDDPATRQSTITTLEKGFQGRKRRILSHAFSPAALQGSDDILYSVSSKWVSYLASRTSGSDWSSVLEMHELSDRYAMDAAATLTFGKSFDLIGSEEYRFMPSWITSSFRLLTFIGHSPILPYWPTMKRFKFNYLLDYDGWSRRPRFEAIVGKLMTERAQAEDDSEEPLRKDFFHWLRTSVDSETKEPYSMPEVLTECAMLMNGGTGGPSTMLTGCFFYLTAYPDVLAKVTYEVRQAFTSSEDIKAGPALNSCVYLQAVLEEAARLSTAHAGTLPRRVMAGGQIVDGIHLPADTVVGVAAYAVHHKAEYFPSPCRFWPERWIVNEKEGFDSGIVAKAKSALFSFSAGGNNCIGKPTAYRMLGLPLAKVLCDFDIRKAAGYLETEEELPFEDMFSARPAAVRVQLKRRKHDAS